MEGDNHESKDIGKIDLNGWCKMILYEAGM